MHTRLLLVLTVTGVLIMGLAVPLSAGTATDVYIPLVATDRPASHTVPTETLIIPSSPESFRDDLRLIQDVADGRHVILDMSVGIYTGSVTVPDDNITFAGAGRPAYAYTDGQLEGGTIIRGTVDLAGRRHITLQNLGVDVSRIGGDAIRSGPQQAGVRTYTTIRNVAAAGSAPNNGYHALVLTSGSHNTIEGVRLYRASHCLALRSSHNIVSDVYAHDCYVSSIIVKSASTSGPASYNQLATITATGTTTTAGGPIIVQAHDGLTTHHVTITGGTMQQPREIGIRIGPADGESRVEHVTIDSALITDAGGSGATGSYHIKGASHVTLTNVTARDVAGYGFRHIGSSRTIGIYNGTVISAGSGAALGTFSPEDISVQPSR